MSALARPYLAALRARFYLTLQYRAAALAGFATQCWWGAMKILVLAAFYHGARGQPMTLGQVISYTWLGQAFLMLLPWNADPDVVEMVRTGAVAYERLRPVDTYAYWYVRALAWTAARVIPRAIPMFALSAVILPLVGLGAWSLRPPADLSAGLLFVVSISCAALLSTVMVQLVTCVVVATMSPRGANAIAPALSNILSGGIVPLLLFPAWMRTGLFLQPFAGLVDIPYRIYLGQLSAFLLLAFAQFANTLVGFVGIWALFARFGTIGGWSLGEIALFYGTITAAFAIADALSRGFDVFGPEFVKTGNFDRLLLRPRLTSLQVAGHELRLVTVGRLAQAIVVLAIGVHLTRIDWSLGAVALLAWTVTGGVAIFYGLLIAQATLSFWTVESLEMVNIVTYGGVEAGQYPLDIYARWFRDIMMFVIPIGCVGYLPLTAILRRGNVFNAPAWAAVASPLVGWLFLGAFLLLWDLGVRRYRSTGS